MDEAAQKEKEARKGIQDELEEAGHKVDTVEPTTAETPLEFIGGAAGFTGEVASEAKRKLVGGSLVETTENKNPLNILKKRLFEKADPNEEVVEVGSRSK